MFEHFLVGFVIQDSHHKGEALVGQGLRQILAQYLGRLEIVGPVQDNQGGLPDNF